MGVNVEPNDIKNYLTERAKVLEKTPPTFQTFNDGAALQRPQLNGSDNPYLQNMTAQSATNTIKEWTGLIQSIGELLQTEPIKSVITRIAGTPNAPAAAAATPEPVNNAALDNDLTKLAYSPAPNAPLNDFPKPHSVTGGGNIDAWLIIDAFNNFLHGLTTELPEIKAKELLGVMQNKEAAKPLYVELSKVINGNGAAATEPIKETEKAAADNNGGGDDDKKQ